MPEIGQSVNSPNITSEAVSVPSNYLICDRTGFRIPVDEGLMEEWNGLKVRKESWEPRHPQDFVRSRAEQLNGSPRPEQADQFIEEDIYPNGVDPSTDL